MGQVREHTPPAARRAKRPGALGALVLAAVAAFGATANPDANALFTAAAPEAAAGHAAGTRADAGALPSKRQRLVSLDTRRLAPPAERASPRAARARGQERRDGGVLRLNLFEDVVFDAEVERTFPIVGGHALIGRLVGVPNGRATLAVRGNTVTGTVVTPTAAYVVRPAGDGRHTVSEVDRAWFPVRGDGGQRRTPPPADAPARMFDPPPATTPPTRDERPVGPRLGTPPPRVAKSAPAPIARGHLPSGVAGFGGRWIAQGPGPILNGQVENVSPNNEVVGAVHTVLAHPTNPDLLYIGAVNGGIWRTDNATAAVPAWRPLTDHASSLSIGAMAFDAEDANTIVAGIGRYSSFGGAGGDRPGLLLSRDGGENWRELRSRFFQPLQNISGVAMRGDRIVVSGALFIGGVFRSTDGGASWAAGDGLPPLTPVFDLVDDPTNADRLYVTVGGRGVFRTDDGGATWQNVSSHDPLLAAAFTAVITREGIAGDNNNAELAVGVDGRVFVAVLVGGQANYIGFTDDQGGSWTAMDLPLTLELDDAVDGLNPRFKPGSQGGIHFSILVDPDDTDIVYVGGDRQNLHFVVEEDGSYRTFNSLGAGDYSGRLFRGDAGVSATGEVPSPQWQHLTHRADVAAIPGGGTSSSSSPHADSREMVFDAQGDIIEVDDGGVYRRTSPKDNTGDWFSLNGNLQVSEMHDIAYDRVAKRLIGGNQDTGTPDQWYPGPVWVSLSTADGGDVAVDTSDAPDRSYRYSSYQFFGAFRRTTYNSEGALTGWEVPALAVNGESVYFLDPNFGFVQHFSLNAVDQRRAVIGAVSVYETFDRFETLTEATSLNRAARERATATAYGCADNADLLYFGHGSAYSENGQITVRRGMGEDDAPTPDDFEATGYLGGSVRAIAIDQDACDVVYAADARRVQVSNDGGQTWRDITGNLANAPVTYLDLQRIVIIPAGGLFGHESAIVVSGRAGVHVMFPHTEGLWFAMNDGLPHAPVWDLDYSPEDNVLFAATLGRGAWRLDPGPTVAARIADQVLEVRDGAVTVDLAGVFTGAEADGFTYAAESGDPAIASARIDGDKVIVTPNAAGAVAIRVTATTAAGLSAVAAFTVTVGAVVEIPAAAVVREGDLLLLPLRISRPLGAFALLRYAVTADDNPRTRDASPDDYVASGVSFLSAETTRATIAVPIRDDHDIEPLREMFKITLTAPTPNADWGLGRQHSTTVTLQEGVCDRSAAVRDAIRADRHCADVAEVATIDRLDLSGENLSLLKPLDFSGMVGLRTLDLSSSGLRSLPPRIFQQLVNLRILSLNNNQLRQLPPGVFFNAPSLVSLSLGGNQLTVLPPSVFFGNPGLTFLRLDNNLLQQLQPGLLLAQVGLQVLDLQNNALGELPDGFFADKVFVSELNLAGNPGAPFTFSLDLTRTDAEPGAPSPAHVALRVRQGTPFAITAPIAVEGGALPTNDTAEQHQATIDAGQLVGVPFQVTQLEDNVATVRVAEAPPVPPGTCGQEACYRGVAIGAGEPLVLFDSTQ